MAKTIKTSDNILEPGGRPMEKMTDVKAKDISMEKERF